MNAQSGESQPPSDRGEDKAPIESTDMPDVDQLVETIRARVEERRASGFYPEGLEEDLSAHFQRILDFRAGYLAPLRHRLEAVRESMGFDPKRISTDSQVLGGEVIHRLAARLVARQTQGVLEQVHAFGVAVREALDGIVQMLEDPSRLQPDVVGQIDAILERLATYERTQGPAAIRELTKRVEELEDKEAERGQ